MLFRSREHMLDSTEVSNQDFIIMKKIFDELQMRGDNCRKMFRGLLKDLEPNIRQAAACLSLWEANDLSAIPVLEEIVKLGIPQISLEAKWTLSEWRDKRLKQ